MTGGDAARARPLRPQDARELGTYELLGRLGEGGMGIVYLGRSATGRLVAIKVIRSELAEDGEFRRRFRSEVIRARSVPSFCTAEVLDADPDHDPPYLVVKYVGSIRGRRGSPDVLDELVFPYLTVPIITQRFRASCAPNVPRIESEVPRMNESPSTRVDAAENALRAFGENLDRADAERLLRLWVHYATLTDWEVTMVLNRFGPAASELHGNWNGP